MSEVELNLTEEFDVAVVVFARAAGADASDAAHRVERAVQDAVGQERPLPHRQDTVKGRVVRFINVMEVGMAAGNGYLWTRPTIKAFRWLDESRECPPPHVSEGHDWVGETVQQCSRCGAKRSDAMRRKHETEHSGREDS